MTDGRIFTFLALAAVLGLAGCERWCERTYGVPNNCGCAPAPQPCCAPASNYPVQPCAPATGGWTPH